MEISQKTKNAYALGGFGKNLAYGLVASYTLFYYKTVLGISGTFVGVLLMAARIFDAFNDPLMGVVVAKTKSPWGRYKPWILSGTLLNCLVMAGMFSVPEGLSGGALKAFVAVTYLLCGITYTLSDIPYWSVIPAVTRPGAERESMTVLARTLAGIGAAAPTIVTMALVALLGGGSENAQYRVGFSRLACLFALVYAVTNIITVKELPSGEISEPHDASVKELLDALLKNDQAMSLSAVIVLFNSAIYLTTNLILYMFRYDVGNESQYTLFMAFSGVAQFAAMVVLYPTLRRRFSNRRIYGSACLIGMAGYLLLTLLAFGGQMTMGKLLVPGMCISLANGFGYVMTTVLVADAVDYGEAKTGKREDSMVSSLQTLMVKLSSAFAVFIAGIGIDFAAPVDGLAVQTGQTILRLRLLFAVPPFLLMLGAFLIFRRKKSIGA